MAKWHNPRLAKIHRSYTVAEAAVLYSAHRNTVRNWIKRGLPTVKTQAIVLILGADLRTFLEREGAKPKCRLASGELYCLKCRLPRAPGAGGFHPTQINGRTANVSAVCGVCGTRMFRRVALGKLAKCGFAVPTAQPATSAQSR